MSSWREQENGLDSECFFDPLCVERSKPIDDDEAALVEAICRAAIPGPLVVDDHASGEGAMVAVLADGRTIVSLSAGVEHSLDGGAAEANAELICKARYLLLRLLRDRQQWKDEREFLVQRIRTLESLLKSETGRTSAAAEPSRAPLPR